VQLQLQSFVVKGLCSALCKTTAILKKKKKSNAGNTRPPRSRGGYAPRRDFADYTNFKLNEKLLADLVSFITTMASTALPKQGVEEESILNDPLQPIANNERFIYTYYAITRIDDSNVLQKMIQILADDTDFYDRTSAVYANYQFVYLAPRIYALLQDEKRYKTAARLLAKSAQVYGLQSQQAISDCIPQLIKMIQSQFLVKPYAEFAPLVYTLRKLINGANICGIVGDKWMAPFVEQLDSTVPDVFRTCAKVLSTLPMYMQDHYNTEVLQLMFQKVLLVLDRHETSFASEPKLQTHVLLILLTAMEFGKQEVDASIFKFIFKCIRVANLKTLRQAMTCLSFNGITNFIDE